MHGRLKIRTSEEEKIQKEKERAKKVIKYKSAMSIIMAKRENNINNRETLEMIAEILSNNPDIYSLWNYRREILIALSNSETPEDMNKLYDSELYLTEMCLKKNPKSYSSWYQRIWVLNYRPEADWNKELKLCDLYLRLDERNFHCWDYRRHIVSKMENQDEREFKFSTDKIKENFSNYSAWHYRSKLLTKLYPDPEGIRSIEEACHRDELELVINAAFTDPNDTSAWFYQRWLLGASLQEANFAVIRVTPKVSYISFNQAVSDPCSRIEVDIDGSTTGGKWQSLSGYRNDVVWVFKHSNDILLQPDTVCRVDMILDKEIRNSLSCDYVDGELIGYAKTSFSNKFGVSVLEELQKQVESCEQLLEMEPDSKWTQLALATITHSISQSENYKNCIKILDILSELDPKRKNYYKDVASKWHLEFILQEAFEFVKCGKFQSDVFSVELSTVYHLQYWSANKVVYLNDNRLTNQCLPKLYVLHNCEELHLENNSITTLKGFPSLPNLKSIYLKGNDVRDTKYLSACPLLVDIILE